MTERKIYDPDHMNDKRADWARAALMAFMRETHTDSEDAICDLICDLQHLCDRDKQFGKFSTGLDRGTGHYENETSKDGGWD